ncbi:MAG: helix-turn-helix transcriptional regulator [Microscillaceae bacterium]|jgi:transcriptional regulator with XRE-family HTH domain|nr:helix-turn-helix transcriptional regulator [Microscillaceae bacterium]
MKIENNIKKLREMRNHTQEVMAKKLSISQNAYCKIESGKTDLSFARLVQICQALEIDLFDLINFDGQKIPVNISNSQNGVPFAGGSNAFVQELQKLYEARIADLQKEIDRLHNLLEKTLAK